MTIIVAYFYPMHSQPYTQIHTHNNPYSLFNLLTGLIIFFSILEEPYNSSYFCS